MTDGSPDVGGPLAFEVVWAKTTPSWIEHISPAKDGVLAVGSSRGATTVLFGKPIASTNGHAVVGIVSKDGVLSTGRQLDSRDAGERAIRGAVLPDGSVIVGLRFFKAGETLGRGCGWTTVSGVESQFSLVRLGPDLLECRGAEIWLSEGGITPEIAPPAPAFASAFGQLFFGFRGPPMAPAGTKGVGPILVSVLDDVTKLPKWAVNLPLENSTCKGVIPCGYGAQSIAVAPDGVVVGSNADALDTSDYALAASKVSSAGKLLWTQRIRCEVPSKCTVAFASETPTIEVATDAAGNTYLTSAFEGRVLIGSTVLDAGAVQAQLLAKLDSTGKPVWAKALRSAAKLDGSLRSGGIVVDDAGHVVVGVPFATSLDVDGANLGKSAGEAFALLALDGDGALRGSLVVADGTLNRITGLTATPDGIYVVSASEGGAKPFGATPGLGDQVLARLRLR